MYEYIIRQAPNEAQMEKIVNAAAEAGWEPIHYALRPSGGVFFLFLNFWADHFVMLRRPKES